MARTGTTQPTRRRVYALGGLDVTARLLTGLIWIVAGALKVPDPAASVRAVRAYQLLPETIVPTVGHLLPIVEIVLGLCLVLGLLTRVAALGSAVLFLAFTLGIAAAWARGLQIDCGCFGGGGYDPNATSKYPWEIARDVLLLATSVVIAALPRAGTRLDHYLFTRPDPEPS